MVGLFVLWGVPIGAGAEVTPPVFRDVTVTVTVTMTAGAYRYEFGVQNAPMNTLVLRWVDLDLKPGGSIFTVGAFPAATGFCGVDGNNGLAYWGPGARDRTAPGHRFEGFGLSSSAPPTIRRLFVQPYLLDYLAALIAEREANGGDLPRDEYKAIELRYILTLKTLGPLGVTVGTLDHWDTFIGDVAEAGRLGWIAEPALLTGIQRNLTPARQAVVARDKATVRARLQAVIRAIKQSTPAQRTSEGYALVLFNAQALQPAGPDPAR